MQLNASIGHGSSYQIIRDYGLTAPNFNSAPNDPFPDSSNQQGHFCFDPGSDAGLFSYSAPAIRSTDGKLVAVGTGGHCASGVSTVVTFDVLDAATKLNSGGPGGVWTMPVKPARLLMETDPRPLWSPQNGPSRNSGTRNYFGWFNTNPDGQQMPASCHEYWSNQWIPGTRKSIWSGTFCTSDPAGVNPGGAGYYDDDTATVHFPTLVNANTALGYFPVTNATKVGPGAMNDLDRCYYIWTQADAYSSALKKWCHLDSTPTLTSVGGTGTDMAGSYKPGWMTPDPTSPKTRRWFYQYGLGACGSCLLLWKDAGPTPGTSFSYSRLQLLNAIPTSPNDYNNASLSTSFAYEPGRNVIIAWAGGNIIYQIADATTGQLSANTTNWRWSVYGNGAHGVSPPFAYNSGAPAAIVSLEPRYHAFVAYDLDNKTNKAGVYLYVK